MNTSMMVKTALLAALMAATAQIAIPQPFSAVPITLQVFFALLAGAVLGPNYGALSMTIYILMGIIGLPVFAGGSSGFGVLIGPWGGYLFGFIASAYIVGLIATKGSGATIQLAIAMGIGIIIIYIFGVVQLALVNKITFVQAIVGGALPFILIDCVKAVVAVGVARRIGVATAGK